MQSNLFECNSFYSFYVTLNQTAEVFFGTPGMPAINDDKYCPVKSLLNTLKPFTQTLKSCGRPLNTMYFPLMAMKYGMAQEMLVTTNWTSSCLTLQKTVH